MSAKPLLLQTFMLNGYRKSIHSLTLKSIRGVAPVTAVALFLASPAAHADEVHAAQFSSVQTALPSTSPFESNDTIEVSSGPQAPEARRGFQMAIGGGYQLPYGSASNSTNIAEAFGDRGQVNLQIGGKLTDHLYLGGYGTFAAGGAGSALSSACSASGARCSQVGLHLGIEAQYHFRPSARINPNVGYGIGLEASSANHTVMGQRTSLSFSGPEYGRLTVGADYRVSKGFGVGPFVQASLAQYTRVSAETQGTFGSDTTKGSIDDKGLHGFFGAGVRMTIMP